MRMNQILITDENKRNSSNFNNKNAREPRNPEDVSGLVKVFAFIILIFGIALSGNGAYAIIKNAELARTTKIPVVEVSKSGNTAKLSIKCETGIRTISLAWNNSTPKIVQGRGKTLIEQTVSIPSGENNKLNLVVVDSKGQTRRYIKNLKQDPKDTTEPTIKFEVIDSSIKITATDTTEIDKIIYQYGNQEKVTISAEEEGQTIIEEKVEVIQGENILKVEAYDKEQNVAVEEKTIIGKKEKPTIEVIPDPNDPSYVIIKASDEKGLRMISYFINNQEYKTDPNISLNSKTFEWRQKVEPGTTKILVHAYNINEQVTEFNITYNY